MCPSAYRPARRRRALPLDSSWRHQSQTNWLTSRRLTRRFRYLIDWRDANNVLRSFRAVVAKITLTAEGWTPREMRHSFFSLLSDSGVPIENIARLVGHAGGSEVTETVYRKQIKRVLLDGAEAMDRIFPGRSGLA